MKNDKIIETSLQEESERLRNILSGRITTYDNELETSLIDWANSLLMAASENEPGQVRLLPPLPPIQRGGLITKTPHQRIGSGPSNEIIELK